MRLVRRPFIARAFIAALVGVVAVSAGAVVPLSAQAATQTRMTAFTMTPAVSSPTGLGTTTITVSTHLVDPDGIEPVDAVGDGIVLAHCPCVQVSQTPRSAIPQEGIYSVPLTLRSGTAKDGTWSGTFVVGSGQTGKWRTTILAGDFGVPLIPDIPYQYSSFAELPSPFTNVGLDIRGTNHPVIGLLSVVKQATGRYLVTGRVTRATTHTPIANTRFEVTGDCRMMDIFPIIGVRTNAKGVYSVSLTKAQLVNPGSGSQICVSQMASSGGWRLTQSVIRPIR